MQNNPHDVNHLLDIYRLKCMNKVLHIKMSMVVTIDMAIPAVHT